MINKLSNSNSSSWKEKEKINIAIPGDSIIKHLKGSNNISKYQMLFLKVFFKDFGVKVLCRKDHMKITPQEKPDYVVLHVRTSDLNSNREPEHTSESIVYIHGLHT